MRRSLLVLSAILIGLGASYMYLSVRSGRVTVPSQYRVHSLGQPSSATSHFDHVVLIVEENKPVQSIIGNPNAPYIQNLISKYSTADHYFAVTNPSLPNYLALTSGTTAGFTSDCSPSPNICEAHVTNIADRLERANKSWKVYAEDMPLPCYTQTSGQYAVKHNPFLYYPDITSNRERCTTHVVPFTSFSTDLRSPMSLPNYSLVVPNLCNDMHNCSVRTGDTWLSLQVPKILTSPSFTTHHSLLVIVWDEGNTSVNNVPAIFVGPAAKLSYRTTRLYTHYSLLHTIEQNWGLARLTQNDSTAPTMLDMLR